MDLLDKDQIRDWDRYTIEQDKLTSVELMEKASSAFTGWFTKLYFDKKRPISVIAGPSNNGGDGLVVARLLRDQGYNVDVHLMKLGKELSLDNLYNLKKLYKVCRYDEFVPLDLSSDTIIIDALLGTGLRGPVREPFVEVIKHINELPCEVVSIDVPSGLDCDEHGKGAYVQSSRVLSFEVPKRSFFTESFRWDYRPIGLKKEFLNGVDTSYKVITRDMIRGMFHRRSKKDSKYKFGFGQFCGGSLGMLGAVILGSRAAMRSGLGRLVATIPEQYQSSFLTACPEVMVQSLYEREKESPITYSPASSQITAVAVGPGLSSSEAAVQYIDSFLDSVSGPCIFDADALNIIARQNWHSRLPSNAVITPHEKEFDRLFGDHENRSSRIKTQIIKAQELGLYIVLKGAHSAVATPDGYCYYNVTGNVGMATAGSGDVLTGILLGFLGQGYSAKESSLMAVYLHGLAGDQACLKYGEHSLIASDITEYLPEVLKSIYGR